MMRSLFSGVSGLRNHQTRMDVIGNDISNVNTVGYKMGRATFSDVLSQTMQGASAGSGNRGGTNPMQVGLGMGLASIDTIFTTGSAQPTGKQTDLAIQRDGFFILGDGDSKVFTRAGNFDFDTLGNYVVPGTGMKVQGWMADNNGMLNTTGSPTGISVPKGVTMPAKTTTAMTTIGNLSANLPVGKSLQTDVAVYDSLGIGHNMTAVYYKAGENKWLMGISSSEKGANILGGQLKEISFTRDGVLKPPVVDATLDPNFTNVTITGGTLNNTPNAVSAFNLSLRDAGLREHNLKLQFVKNPGANYTLTVFENGQSIFTDANAAGVPATLNVGGTAFNITSTMGQGATFVPPTSSTQSMNYTAGTGDTDLTVNFNNGSSVFSAANKFKEFSQYGGPDTAPGLDQDGYAAGTLDSVNFDTTGIMTGKFSNGRTRALAQVALAVFNNPGGLDKVGNTLFVKSNNSGEPRIGTANSGGRGGFQPGCLEMSNVDLAEEFSNMIITQRGFQANSKTITTTDQMLEELVNLKR